MKIISSHFKKGDAKIKIESLDDLWYLSQIIDAGDIVKGKTLRKIKVGSAEKEAVRKSVFIVLKVEKVEFSKTTNRLRVLGTIIEGPEDVQKGSYHTFNIEEDTIITLVKEQWPAYQIKQLKDAAQASDIKILICVFDREDAFFALMKRAGHEVLTHIKGDVAKKAVDEPVKATFYSQIIKQLEEYDKRFKLDKIILASPAFWKEELFKVLKNDDLKKKIVPASCSSADESAITEVLKREEVQKALKEERVSEELSLVEQVLSEISKQGLAAYGLDEVEQAVNSGAVKDLLVTDALIMKLREEEKFARLDDIMKSADKNRAGIHIISVEHAGGKKLEGLGGIAALLRFKLSY
ncbi:mRNA surveillance protein pelota [Candidatus Woesearchaeota archaeon]|nr:mRNA surveillance protein pelota [Candidatus Woesearchaeota archaeon]MBW2993791.1 mRNA surveillance protein pelota [Candidatus Woesearchaeota archaeon]